MGWFRFNMRDELEKNSDLLDRAFAGRRAQIDERESSREVAIIKCEDVLVMLWRDRNSAIFCDIEFPVSDGLSDIAKSHTGLLASFSDLSAPDVNFNREGVAVDPPSIMIKRELELVEKLSSLWLFDPDKRPLAASFIDGYEVAYNEWAAGEWKGD